MGKLRREGSPPFSTREAENVFGFFLGMILDGLWSLVLWAWFYSFLVCCVLFGGLGYASRAQSFLFLFGAGHLRMTFAYWLAFGVHSMDFGLSWPWIVL